ncbi:MAG: ABC transporter substrate-binding protein [Bacilli bacterium]|nr:ABC transporter substrate-binding protein [Bacilli bacterium]
MNEKIKSPAKRAYSFLLLSLFCIVPALSSCSSAKADVVLHVYNAEDYVDSGSDAEELYFADDNGYEATLPDVLGGFEQYMFETTGKTVKVVYDTYDTNETMYSSLKTGKTTYDLICASDYMCQKMLGQGMLQKIDYENDVPNYAAYGSEYIKNVFKSIKAEMKHEDGSVTTEVFSDYAVDYMWGTLGILYNPAKIVKDKYGLTVDDEGFEDKASYVKASMNTYEALWNPEFSGEMSVKDSMRDTYALGLLHTYNDEIEKLFDDSGCFDEDFNLLEGKYEEAMGKFNDAYTAIFNRCDENTVNEVKKTLLALKQNVFGFEVDSGKEDIVKGLVGMNSAWSGDAVYSMDCADEIDNTLYYALPKTGGNIWFDTWVMPKESSGLNREYALKFLDFLSSPYVASANMNYVGYTSCIAGEAILDLIREWYDPRTFEIYAWDDEVGDFVYDENDEYVFAEGMENATYTTIDGSETWDALAEENEWDVVDLTYMFEGTLSDDYLADYPSPLGDTPSTNPYLFYTDEREYVEEEDGSEVMVGRQFFTQYPYQELLPKLAIMADYGGNNKYVLSMWEDVKSNNLPIAAVVIFAIVLGTMGVAIVYTFIARRRFHKIKIARRKEINAARAQ